MFLRFYLKWFYIYLLKIKIAHKKKTIFGRNSEIDKRAFFEGRNLLSKNSRFISSYLGFASYIGENSSFKSTKIGRYCSIGSNVKCVIGKHPTSNFVSTHPAFFSLRKQLGFTYVKEQLFDEFEKPLDENGKYLILIGNDVWIGDGVSIMEGVTIGDGAIIASNALVVKDVEPYAIVTGVPARILKFRFESSDIEFLINFKWWNKGEEWIKKYSRYFNDIKILKLKVQ
ncbi:CatB-related O-acetyltransferase [Aestuariibaculum sediminum]|uniref:CatB-related O-acetyltransferase n=1 Tax=Aestuariibaculum sediminum TaxID=2770637 RepID=A0A8J6UF22_9FLAO|nr:CatB-related O-acetyltransferase [Aestuariibaculum sediminum]MBD0831211.1 CatB-related O-acetyltransferase [Aestuariibaculum sediminum]